MTAYHTANIVSLAGHHSLLVWGGLHNRAPTTKLEIFDLETNVWRAGEYIFQTKQLSFLLFFSSFSFLLSPFFLLLLTFFILLSSPYFLHLTFFILLSSPYFLHLTFFILLSFPYFLHLTFFIFFLSFSLSFFLLSSFYLFLPSPFFSFLLLSPLFFIHVFQRLHRVWSPVHDSDTVPS